VTVHDRPTPLELLEAVTEFLSGEIAPVLDDHRLRFRTLVAINALGIAYRELAAEPGPPSTSRFRGEDELRELARQIRAGDASPDLLPLLKEHVAAKLRVSNPRALDRYDA
jgi:hypothetical protein